jgi:hypothetical protein
MRAVTMGIDNRWEQAWIPWEIGGLPGRRRIDTAGLLLFDGATQAHLLSHHHFADPDRESQNSNPACLWT